MQKKVTQIPGSWQYYAGFRVHVTSTVCVILASQDRALLPIKHAPPALTPPHYSFWHLLCIHLNLVKAWMYANVSGQVFHGMQYTSLALLCGGNVSFGWRSKLLPFTTYLWILAAFLLFVLYHWGEEGHWNIWLFKKSDWSQHRSDIYTDECIPREWSCFVVALYL